MFSKIKHRFKKLGFISIELVILAGVMLTAGGYGVAKLGSNASGATKNENELFNSLFGKEDGDEVLPDYVVKINKGVKTIKGNGEASLTDDDKVTINGIDCYVYEISDSGDKAMLITKNVYNVRFDTGGHTSAEVEGHVGTYTGYTDKTYDYKYSTLRTWMNNFYVNKLGADSRILPTTVTYYTSDTDTSNLNNYTTGTIADQYVFALDAKEAKQYSSKFKWNKSNKQINDDGSLSSDYSYYFWTTAGYRSRNGSSYAWNVYYGGGFGDRNVVNTDIGARPAFWISLADKVE